MSRGKKAAMKRAVYVYSETELSSDPRKMAAQAVVAAEEEAWAAVVVAQEAVNP